jgi:hypothetical protein
MLFRVGIKNAAGHPLFFRSARHRPDARGNIQFVTMSTFPLKDRQKMVFIPSREMDDVKQSGKGGAILDVLL